MRKILLVLAILMMPFVAQAQKITEDKVIKALNKRIMTTSWEQVNWNSNDLKLEVSMMLEGRDMSMLFNWQCKEMVGAERDSEIILLFDDMSEVVLLNKAFSVSGAGKVKSESVALTTMGIQLDGKGNFSDLATKTLTNIRLNTTSGQIDIPITTEESLALRKLYEMFDKQCHKSKN